MKKDHNLHDTLNSLIHALSRPWAFIPMVLFVLIPSAKVSSALESGAEFLRIGSDARASSMGGAYTAAANDVSAIHYNPAGLAAVSGTELGLSHAKWLLDGSYDFVGLAMPVRMKSGPQGLVMGLGITRLSSGEQEGRSADRSASGGFGAYDQSVSLSLAKRMGRNGFGVTAKYIESSIAGIKARSVAADLGYTRAFTGSPVSLALAVHNLGAPMKYIDQEDPLPLTLSVGLMVGVLPGVNLALDASRLVHDGETSFSIGSEYAVMPGLSLRSGYMAEIGAGGLGNGAGFNAGVGIMLMDARLDYAVTPFGELGSAQRISLKKKF
ncbi:MAG TPA: hypothetical protein DDW67_02455 [Elusimicrobia bacterium]|nr:hypothetical protein [Elusimicrobiota bacterium]